MKAYNKYRKVLKNVTCSELKLSNKYNKTNAGMDYVYVDIFVTDGLAAIEKIVVEPMGSESVLQIDDFSIGLFQAPPETSSG